jgi:hypothetical protein
MKLLVVEETMVSPHVDASLPVPPQVFEDGKNHDDAPSHRHLFSASYVAIPRVWDPRIVGQDC